MISTARMQSLNRGTVITEKDAKVIAKEFEEVSVYTGIYAQEVKVSNDNVNAVLDLGSRMYVIGRVTKKDEDLLSEDGNCCFKKYIPDMDLKR
jgi:DNA-directed RNA polymerase subunit beta